jgi:hypothetical protein
MASKTNTEYPNPKAASESFGIDERQIETTANLRHETKTYKQL